MATNIGAKVSLDGEKQFRQQISDINNSVRLMQTELSKVSSEFTRNNKTVGDARRENEALQKNIDALNNRMKAQQEGLKNAQKEYGATDKRTMEWQASLNRTQAEVNKLQGRIDSNNDSINEAGKNTKKLSDDTRLFGDSAQEAGTQALKMGDIIKANLISEAVIGGVKALGGALKSIASGALDIGKQAIQSYAEYEQLVGGVETLFKENSDVVQRYAANAFKTAGLSANQYMETVTSFSASLLQSVGGDTAKAAKVADMAITDMADNANKMGTSISSIQTAYQGFAKQNFAMLDNLKLGYGGTQSEMERLLKDATTLSGVKYDISNLNDVYTAINVIQTELGITGTTAKEASQTISGSIGAMKSSYTNFISGLANDNADLSMLATNLIDSVLTVAGNLLPVIERVAESMVDVIPKLLDMIIEYLPSFLQTGVDMLVSLADGVFESLPKIMDVVVELINTFVTKLIEMLPQLVTSGVTIILSLIKGLGETLPQLLPMAVDTILTIVDELINNIDMIIDTGIELILALIDGLIEALPILIERTPMILLKIVEALIRNLPRINRAGIDIVLALIKGLINSIPSLVKSAGTLIDKLWTSFTNNNWVKLGGDIIRGIGQGILNLGGWLANQAKNVGRNMLNGVKDFFGIKSPSKKMQDEVGVDLAKGLGLGFEKEMAKISTDMIDAVPLDFESNATVSYNAQNQSKMDELINLTKALINKPTYIVLDTGQLVGGIGDGVDKFLANKLKLATRG
mgnify:CR=1 FL=1